MARGRQEQADRIAVERFMGWARVVGALLAYSQFIPFTHFPPGVKPFGLGIATFFLLHGLLTLRRNRDSRGPVISERLERELLVTFALDLAALTALNLALAYEEGSTTRGLLLLMVLEGAMKYRRSGAFAVFIVVVFEELARFAVRTQIYEKNSDVAEGTFFMGLTLLVALFAGWMAHLAHEALEKAKDATRRANLANEELDALNRVILAGVEGIGEHSMSEMLAEITAALDADRALVVLRDDDGGTYTAASHGHQTALLEPVVVDRNTPLDDVLTGRTSDPFVTERPDEAYAPIRVHGELLGALIVQRDEPRERSLPLGALSRVAHQIGLVIRAAQAYAQQAALTDRMQELEQLRADFVTVASHELRTPVTAILGFAETLQRGDSSVEPSILIGSILRQSLRLRALVDDLSTVLALDGGRLRVEVQETVVAPSVLRAVDRTDAPVDVRGELAARAVCDPQRLEQVVLQLLQNGIEHGGGQGLAVEVRDEAESIEIVVCDDGPGVPADLQARLFDRYVQGTAALNHQRGSGLGLAIVRELTEAMGGRAYLPPSEVGARFVVSLPPTADAPASAEERPAEADREGLEQDARRA